MRKTLCLPLAISLVSFGINLIDLKPVLAQAYSKTFVIKGKDGGRFRVKAYLRDAKGVEKVKVSVTKKPGAAGTEEANNTEEKSE